MYKFLMVDDEELVRRGFEAKIDWPASGFEFLPPCENGRDAIAAIDELAPDVVMTDIHMPHADGITVAAHVMETRPEIVVVILSGYDEFGYAQAAIRNKVFDYVLKPVTSRDLTALLAKLKAKLDADRRAREDSDSLRLAALRSGNILRDRRLAALIEAGGAAPSAAEAAEALGFDPGPYACVALVAELELSRPGGEELRARLGRALAGALRSATIPLSEARCAALIFEKDRERCSQAAASAAMALIGDSGAAAGGGLRAGVGRTFASWIDAPRSYAEAVSALSYRLVRAPSRPFLYAQAAEAGGELAEPRSREERLRLGLRTGAAALVPGLAREYLDALDAADLSPQRVRHEILALFSRVHDDLSAVGVSSAELASRLAGDFYRLAESLAEREEVEAALVRLAEIAAGALEAASLREPEWKVLDFKDFVARHYADSGLSIGKAAARLSISESYLSKLLRRRLGASFVDYLADYRVDRAKELLAASDMHAYEVAEAVGYPDARYFGSIFKRRTGMTPSEYRASLGALARGGRGSGA
jgi:two-component system, response regulator YesN